MINKEATTYEDYIKSIEKELGAEQAHKIMSEMAAQFFESSSKHYQQVHFKDAKGTNRVLYIAPGQKVIQVSKVRPKSYVLDLEANKVAANHLSRDTWCVYMYFVLKMPGHMEVLKLKRITDMFPDMTEEILDKAIDELIEKNYLIKGHHDEIKEFYIFYEGGNSNA